MENTLAQNGVYYHATIDVAHYEQTGEIIYTSSRTLCEIKLEPEILDMLQNSSIGIKRLSYLLNREKFLHIANQTRMNDHNLAVYFGCTIDVIRILKQRYGFSGYKM